MDKYDEAIAYLTENPERIYAAWVATYDHPAGCLFNYATPDRYAYHPDPRKDCGCLTLIRGDVRDAWTDELTDAIRADERIPDSESRITVESLPVFAEWQRRLDREIRNTTTAHTPE